MVRIRYAELPVGLHYAVRSAGHRTTVYLLPGLSPEQRRTALAGARRAGRLGQGPRIPATDMALAIAADRMRTTTRNGAAALRKHPMLVLLPLLVAATGVAAVLVSAQPANLKAPAGIHSHEAPGKSIPPQELVGGRERSFGEGVLTPSASARPTPAAQPTQSSPTVPAEAAVQSEPSPQKAKASHRLASASTSPDRGVSPPRAAPGSTAPAGGGSPTSGTTSPSPSPGSPTPGSPTPGSPSPGPGESAPGESSPASGRS